MDFPVLLCIGLVMGLFGGFLGIGGSVVMIPAMTLCFGEDQHLYQAAAMICNFFVAGISLIAHRKAKTLGAGLLRNMIPAAVIGIMLGVTLSNAAIFAGANSYWLARIFGLFLVYVAVYNGLKFHPRFARSKFPFEDQEEIPFGSKTSLGIGLITGVGAGLLGIGAGSIATPLQQTLLKVPMRKAMSNSAAMIVSIAWLGAIYKNATLGEQSIEWTESLKIAAMIIPAAIVGSYLGSHMMHALPKNAVRAVFVAVCALAAFKLLTVGPA